MKKCCKLFGYGGVIWGVAFIVASIFIAFNVTSGIIMQGTTTLAVISTVYLLAKRLNISARKEMLKYGLAWVLVVLILDLIVTTRFTGWGFFCSWYIWIAYLLILFTPLLAVKPKTTS